MHLPNSFSWSQNPNEQMVQLNPAFELVDMAEHKKVWRFHRTLAGDGFGRIGLCVYRLTNEKNKYVVLDKIINNYTTFPN